LLFLALLLLVGNYTHEDINSGKISIAALIESWSSLDSNELTNIARAKAWALVIFDLDGACSGTSLRGEKMTNVNKSYE
jgi:hypothetical protein